MAFFTYILLHPSPTQTYTSQPSSTLSASSYAPLLSLWGELTADRQLLFTSEASFQKPVASLQDKSAKGGGFDAARADYLSVEKVSLELHEEVIGAGATVYAESAEINARILLHGFQNVVYLIGPGTLPWHAPDELFLRLW